MMVLKYHVQKLIHVAIRQGISGHEGERTGGSVDCQIPQAGVDTLRAETFQFNVAYGLARHEGSAFSRPEHHNLP